MKTLKNQKGFLSVDFLISIVIAMTLSMMLFALCFTLTTIEVAQYVAFSVARSYSVGHLDPDTQERKGREKLQKILTQTTFGQLFNRQYGWFELSRPEFKRGLNAGDQFEEYDAAGSAERLPQTGFRITLIAKILNFQVGPLGKSSDENDGIFATKVTGLLFREPSEKECQAQLAAPSRLRAIKELDPRFAELMSRQQAQPARDSDYIPVEDNGC